MSAEQDRVELQTLRGEAYERIRWRQFMAAIELTAAAHNFDVIWQSTATAVRLEFKPNPL